jgi:hypothetical protein
MHYLPRNRHGVAVNCNHIGFYALEEFNELFNEKESIKNKFNCFSENM